MLVELHQLVETFCCRPESQLEEILDLRLVDNTKNSKKQVVVKINQ